MMSITTPDSGTVSRDEASVITPNTIGTVILDALRKFDPRYLWHNPVLLLTEAGAVLTTVVALAEPFLGGAAPSGGTVLPQGFTWMLVAGFWFCLFTATLAESIAEGRGRSQTAALRRSRATIGAHRVADYDAAKDPSARSAVVADVDARELRLGDIVVVEAGEIIPVDGEILWGAAEVDESAFTGHPGAVIRQSAGDSTAVTGGTRDLSDRLVMRVSASADAGAVERTIRLASRARRKKSPIEVAFSALLSSFSLSFVFLVLMLNAAVSPVAPPVSIPILVAVVVCLIPTEIAALMSVTGIAAMSQLLRRGVLVTSAKALETAGDITTVLLDKTGTVTRGNRTAVAFVTCGGASPDELIRASALASAGDPTPEGASTVTLAARAGVILDDADLADAVFIQFSATTRLSGIDLSDGTCIRKGATTAVIAWLKHLGTQPPRAVLDELKKTARAIADSGGTPLAVAMKRPATRGVALGVIHLEDVVKDGVREHIGELHDLGVRTVLVTGDHELTARAISAEVGIEEYLGDSAPEDKLALIHREQANGHLVAMSGDGINDAPALAQADIGIAMNSSTSEAKESANMMILDDDPARLVDIIEVGRRQMATRGALITFNFANDAVRYFTLFPALFVGFFPGLEALNILRLHSPASAILSTVIFSSVVMGILIPLAIIGVPYRTQDPSKALSRNLLICGLSGLLVPIIAIKVIDLVVSLLPGF